MNIKVVVIIDPAIVIKKPKFYSKLHIISCISRDYPQGPASMDQLVVKICKEFRFFSSFSNNYLLINYLANVVFFITMKKMGNQRKNLVR